MKKLMSIGFVMLALATMIAAAGCDKDDGATPEKPPAPKDHPAH